MATSYHQLGILAQNRGDYGEAERRYQQALTIAERLGNQAGMARSHTQLGILRAEQADVDTAIGLHLQALATRLRLGIPQAAINLRALAQLRTRIGNDQFTTHLHQHLDETSTANLLNMLDQTDSPDT